MERPILMSTWSVGGIQSGLKTETRRIVKPQPKVGGRCIIQPTCKYGEVDDVLWVRETFAKLSDLDTTDPGTSAFADGGYYRADYTAGLWDDNGNEIKWRPSIFMPKDMCRIKLKVTGVHMELLHEIDRESMLAEGLFWNIPKTHRDKVPIWDLKRAWIKLWDELNKEKGFGWDTSPWVHVIKFEKL